MRWIEAPLHSAQRVLVVVDKGVRSHQWQSLYHLTCKACLMMIIPILSRYVVSLTFKIGRYLQLTSNCDGQLPTANSGTVSLKYIPRVSKFSVFTKNSGSISSWQL